MANYKVGDTVVCIDSTDSCDDYGNYLILGEKYVVEKIVHDTYVSGMDAPWFPWRFIKLDGLKEDTTEKQELETY